jgi:capsular polysaccharide transport system permease protein
MTSIILDKIKRKISPIFIITVIIPTALSVLYFGLLASDIYISESRFVVRTPEKPAPSGLGIILKTAGFSNSNDETSAAQSAVISRDALRSINIKGDFEKSYRNPAISIFDRFDPLGLNRSVESLYRYFKKKVTLEHDSSTSISVLTVRAYTPQDAQRFNERLLEMAEATVNRLNRRGRSDLIEFARKEVSDAQANASQTAQKLSYFRNHTGVVDPEKQATVQMQMISKLQDELISTKTELRAIQKIAPRAPQIEVLEIKINELQGEIERQVSHVAGASDSLAATQAKYQRLLLDNQIAEKQLGGALSSLEEARNEAGRKQAYVERIVQPNLPDSAPEPQRLRGILSVFVLSLVAFGVVSMLIAGIREHRD